MNQALHAERISMPGALAADRPTGRLALNLAQSAEWSSLLAALHAEWTKLRTVASTGWLLLACIALTVGGSATAADVVKCPASCSADVVRISLTGVELGQAIVAVLAVLMISTEYSTGMIRITVTAIPRRLTMLVAKAAVLTGMVLAAGFIAVLGSLVASRLILPGNGFAFTAGHGFGWWLGLDGGSNLRAALGSVLYLALIAVLSLGVATAVRDSGVAITVVLGLLYVVPIISNLILDPHWERRFQRYAPTNAGLAVQVTKGLDKLSIGPWEGLAVLAVWAAAALVTGGLLLRFRDA
jgi:ABC-2 type transport system permease protein